MFSSISEWNDTQRKQQEVLNTFDRMIAELAGLPQPEPKVAKPKGKPKEQPSLPEPEPVGSYPGNGKSGEEKWIW
jgi:hypothetical protein